MMVMRSLPSLFILLTNSGLLVPAVTATVLPRKSSADLTFRSADRAAHEAVFLAWPRRGSASLADRFEPRPGTRFRWVCLSRGRGAAPRPLRQSFFKRLLGFFVGLGMTRTHGEPAVAKLCQQLADRAFVQRDAEASFQFVAQIHAPPAHHPMTSRIGASLNQPGQFGLLLRWEFWLGTRRLQVVQAAQALSLETWHGRDGVALADERARQQGTQTSTYTGAPVLDPTCERPVVKFRRPTHPKAHSQSIHHSYRPVFGF